MGDIKKQNKQSKNIYSDKIGRAPRAEYINDLANQFGDDSYWEGDSWQRNMNRDYILNETPPARNFGRSLMRFGNLDDAMAAEQDAIANPYKLSKPAAGKRMVGGAKISGIPALVPEALGVYGATQEAQRQGVNPMVNWLQRMTPVPVVAPTGNGGEVYNYQSGERYTPMY